jgi:DNA (cytosine-5)-methyltransferase 1
MSDTITAGSLFSGIGGFDLGFSRAGIATRWFVERDPACQRVLAERFPGVPIHDDVTTVSELPYVDIITAGVPCQDVSVAGKRAGLAGARTGLFWEAVRIVAETRPAVFVLENVPGLLSSNRGRDFGTVLDALAELGALDICWRILDAQFFGVAQRRRRVFVVADFRGERAGEILALSDSLSGHPPPRRKTRQDVAGTLGGGAGERGWAPDTDRMTFVPTYALQGAGRTSQGSQGSGWNEDVCFTLNNVDEHAVAWVGSYGGGGGVASEQHPTLQASGGEDERGVRNPLVIVADLAQVASHGNYSSPQPCDPCHPLTSAAGQSVVAFTQNQSGDVLTGDVMHALSTNSNASGRNSAKVASTMAVRRLTPVENSRLQGFPDDWLDTTPPLSDSAKYRMLGNAVCVNVSAWLGKRIAEVAA